MDVRLFFGRKHILKTVLITVLCAIFIWLGLWQVERLAWRRSLNAELAAQLAQPPLLLNELTDGNTLLTMTDRDITATGSFDFSQQIIVKSQNSQFGSGIRLVAPFVLDGSERAILVDRGWISNSELSTNGLDGYDEPNLTTIEGVVRQSQTAPNGSTTTSQQPVSEVFRIIIPTLQSQMPYELLPVYMLQSPTTTALDARPFREPFVPDLSEGNHLSYVIQWFSFAVIFGLGYIGYIRRNGKA